MNLAISTANQVAIIAGAVIAIVIAGIFIVRAEYKLKRKLRNNS